MNISNNDISGLIDELELDAEAVYSDYSGRNMYGKTCFGLVLPDHISAVRLGVTIAQVISNEDLIVELVSDARTDNMGLEKIIYFPKVTTDSWGV